jgi:hypothetical protein
MAFQPQGVGIVIVLVFAAPVVDTEALINLEYVLLNSTEMPR